MGSGVLVRVLSATSYGGNEDRWTGLGRLPLRTGVSLPEFELVVAMGCVIAFSGISPSLSTTNVLEDENS